MLKKIIINHLSTDVDVIIIQAMWVCLNKYETFF